VVERNKKKAAKGRRKKGTEEGQQNAKLKIRRGYELIRRNSMARRIEEARDQAKNRVQKRRPTYFTVKGKQRHGFS